MFLFFYIAGASSSEEKVRFSVCGLLLRSSKVGAKYCDESVYVCVSVHEHISGTDGPIFINFFMLIPYGLAQPSSGGVAIGYVRLVLWITSHSAAVALWHAY